MASGGISFHFHSDICIVSHLLLLVIVINLLLKGCWKVFLIPWRKLCHCARCSWLQKDQHMLITKITRNPQETCLNLSCFLSLGNQHSNKVDVQCWGFHISYEQGWRENLWRPGHRKFCTLFQVYTCGVRSPQVYLLISFVRPYHRPHNV